MSRRISHELHYSLRSGWWCIACPFTAEDTEAGTSLAVAHQVAHQYQVAPPKPIADRPRGRRR